MSVEPEQLTLIAAIGDIVRHERALAQGYTERAITEADEQALSEIYRTAYSDQHTPDDAAARHELTITYAGEYGVLDLEASRVIERDGQLVAAVMLVEGAPWPGSPPGPFVIEVMTEPASRRHGLAEHAIVRAARVLEQRGAPTMALFVMSANAPARRLYEKLGFLVWES